MNDLILKNARIISNSNSFKNVWIKVANGKIENISETPIDNHQDTIKVIDCRHKKVIPSFIDIHCHGGYSYSFMNNKVPLKTSLEKYSREVLKEGVTNYCVGSVSASKPEIDDFCHQLGDYMQTEQTNAQVVGAYLEGSFISHQYKGAHDESVLAKPNFDWVKEWQKLANNNIKIIAYAPELDLNFSKFLLEQDIIPSFAHSSANYEQTQTAIANGIKNVTHFYNAMTPFSHRNPGAVPAILFNDQVSVELICDGIHVDDAILKLTYQIKGADKIVAITDSVEAKGLEDNFYQLGSLPIIKQKNKVTLLDRKTIAGSVTTMIDNFKKLLTITNYNWQDCIKMTSTNAAKILNLANLGAIKPNYIADLLILDENNNIYSTIKQGSVVYYSREEN